MYYTPQAIIDQINNRIFEPAAGSGALLAAAVRSVRHPVISNPPFSAEPKSVPHNAGDVAGAATGTSGDRA
jgi:hypothetical protein